MEVLKEYYILGNIKSYRFIIVNQWHEFRTDRWHLIAIYKEKVSRKTEYNFCLLGVRLRVRKINNEI